MAKDVKPETVLRQSAKTESAKLEDHPAEKEAIPTARSIDAEFDRLHKLTLNLSGDLKNLPPFGSPDWQRRVTEVFPWMTKKERCSHVI